MFFFPAPTERRSSLRSEGLLGLDEKHSGDRCEHSGLHWDEQSLDGDSSPLSAASPSVFFFFLLSAAVFQPPTHPPHCRLRSLRGPGNRFLFPNKIIMLGGCKAFQLREAFISNVKTFLFLFSFFFFTLKAFLLQIFICFMCFQLRCSSVKFCWDLEE